MDIDVETVSSAIVKSVVHAQEVTSDVAFIALMVAIIAIIYMWPYSGTRNPFEDCFPESGEKGCGVPRPPSPGYMDLIWFFMNATQAFVFIYYFWTSRNPLTSTDSAYYIGILSLFLFSVFLKWLWVKLLYVYRAPLNALFALIGAVFLLLATVVLLILFPIRNAWWSFGFLLPSLVWYIFLIMWTYSVWWSCSFGRTKQKK